jgi:hypothetical protein
MKTAQINNNPTAFFLQQSSNPTGEFKDKINDFVSKLLNLKTCVLCKNEYNFTDKIPRILVHCGHTFCSACLKNFYKNRRIRCPMCLKLIKNIDSLERLPVNHTIFSKMAEECKEDHKKGEALGVGLPTKADLKFGHIPGPKVPFPEEFGDNKKFINPIPTGASHGHKGHKENLMPAHLDINQFMPNPHAKGHQQQQHLPPQEYAMPPNVGAADTQAGDQQEPDLEYCDIHTDRVKHFLCLSHKNICCRVCREILHSKEECVVVDLYETDDVPGGLGDNGEGESKNLFDGNDEELEDVENEEDFNQSTNSI